MDEKKDLEKRQVLHPATAAARRHDRQRAYGGHVRGHTVRTSEVLELMRKHRRLGVTSLLMQILPASIVILCLQFVPEVSSWRPIGSIPFPWLLLGPVALGSVFVSAYFSDRQAIRIDDEWSEAPK